MQLLVVPPSKSRVALTKRLLQALRLEAYFHRLFSETGSEVGLRQWDASRRLVALTLGETESSIQSKNSLETAPSVADVSLVKVHRS